MKMKTEKIVKDLEIVSAIIDKLATQFGRTSDMEYARKLLKDDIDSLCLGMLADNVIANGDICKTDGNASADKKQWVAHSTKTTEGKDEPEGKILPCGRKMSEHSTCPHLSKNGACTATVLTSMPPQYNMCPARGSGFIKCSEA